MQHGACMKAYILSLTLLFFTAAPHPLLWGEVPENALVKIIDSSDPLEEKLKEIRKVGLKGTGERFSLHELLARKLPPVEVVALMQALLVAGADPNELNKEGESVAVAMLKSPLSSVEKTILLQKMLSHQLSIQTEKGLRPLIEAMEASFQGDKLQFVLFLFCQWMPSSEFPLFKTILAETFSKKNNSAYDQRRLFLLVHKMEELARRKELAGVFAMGGTTKLPGGFFPLEGMTFLHSHRFLRGVDLVVEEKILAFLLNSASPEWNFAESRLSDATLRDLYRNTGQSKAKVARAVRKAHEVMEGSLSYLTEPLPELVNRIERGDIVALKVCGSGHLYGVVFFNDYLFICNKGMAFVEEPGIYRVRIGGREGLQEVLTRFKEERPLEETLGLSDVKRPIFSLLGAQDGKVVIRGKPQKVGNCSIASSGLMFQTVLTLLLEQEQVEGAREIASIIKTMQRKWRRELVLKNYLVHHVSVGGVDPISVDTAILQKVLLEKEKEGKGFGSRQMILSWVLHESKDHRIKQDLLNRL